MSANFDSHGMSPLGERMQSTLDAFRKSVTPTQKHIGTAAPNQPLGDARSFKSHIFQIGQSIYALIRSTATIPVQGTVTVPGFIELSLDLASVQRALFLSTEQANPVYGDAVEAGGVIYVQEFSDDAGGPYEVTINTATQKWAAHNFYDHRGGKITNAFVSGSLIVHHFDASSGENPGFLVTQGNGAITKDEKYSHTPQFLSLGCASDGTNYFMIGHFSGASSALVIAKISSNFSVAQVVKYVLPAGAGTLVIANVSYAISSTTLILFLDRTGTAQSPVWLAVDTSDISVIKWSKSSKKQTADVTIGINDTATTYRITIGGQQEQVVGNAGGAAATATDLKNQCAASAQSNFTARTWSVSDTIVTGTANHAGMTWTTVVAVVGGTGTITRIDTQNINPTKISGSAASGEDVIVVGASTSGKYGIAKIRASDGAVLSAALSNELSGAFQPAFSVSELGADVYLVGTSDSSGNTFGGLDLELIPFGSLPSNISVLSDDVSWTASSETLTHTEVTSGFPAISDTQVDMVAPSETFQSADSNYTF